MLRPLNCRRFFTSLRGRGARRPSPMHRRLDDVTIITGGRGQLDRPQIDDSLFVAMRRSIGFYRFTPRPPSVNSVNVRLSPASFGRSCMQNFGGHISVTVRPIGVGFEASTPRPRRLYLGPLFFNFGPLTGNWRRPLVDVR
jgi:hypothetical protein